MTDESKGRLGASDAAKVEPVLPLMLLESIRGHDRPHEVLEEEDFSDSMPRRLGMTGVVGTQIDRYTDALKRGRKVPADEAANLFRLVFKRDDAELILREAGHRIARHHVQGRPGPLVSLIQVLPRFLVAGAVQRSARRIFRGIVGSGTVEIDRGQRVIRVTGGLTSQLDTPSACTLYAGVIEELTFLYAGTRPRVSHPQCSTRGSCCEWTLNA